MNRAPFVSIGITVGVIVGMTFGPGLVMGLLLTSAGCDNSGPPASCGTVDGSMAANEGDAGADRPNGLSINITVNSCPAISALSASPTSTVVGNPINIGASVVDRDVGDTLVFAWTAADGAFGNASTANTTYTCSSPGMKLLTLKISDGHCDVSSTINLPCS
jgi:hypothetical protein